MYQKGQGVLRPPAPPASMHVHLSTIADAGAVRIIDVGDDGSS
jgi:hypothetical protein